MRPRNQMILLCIAVALLIIVWPEYASVVWTAGLIIAILIFSDNDTAKGDEQ